MPLIKYGYLSSYIKVYNWLEQNQCIGISIVQETTLMNTLRHFREARVKDLEKKEQSKQKISDQKEKE